MFIRFRIILLSFSILFLNSCASNETVGSVAGTIVGGIIGSQLGGKHKELGAVFGAVAGYSIGKSLGSYLDDRDQQRISAVLENNVNGQSTSWFSSKKETGMVKITPISYKNNCRNVNFSVETTEGVKHFEKQLCKGSRTWARV